MLRATALATASNIGAIPASEKDQPNGVATLDGTGKIPTSEMPVGDVTYRGNWNAATNTPTLANGVGTAGDLYICDVGGSRNLGGGVVVYAVGDWLIYDGAVWDRVGATAVTPGNPTAQAGSTAINGVATTFMRSDAAPGINVSADYSWSGRHTFIAPANIATPSLGLASSNVQFELRSTNAPADQQRWNWSLGTNNLILRTLNDAGNQSSEVLYMTRSGSQAQTIRFGNDTDSPSFIWAGSNAPWQVSGSNGNSGQPLVSTGNATSPAWGPLLASGAYTPTLTPGANVANATANEDFTYMRVGTSILVAGSINITATAAGAAVLQVSLPVPVTFSSTHKANGSGAATNGTIMTPAYVRANMGAQTAIIDWVAPNNQAQTLRFTALYTTL